jgi:putative transposase
MKFGFIAKHRSIWPVAWLCEALGVSRSGFHAWLHRGPSARMIADEELTATVRASFIASGRTYGARRVWRDVLADGASCGLHKIERLMRANALRARHLRTELGTPAEGAPTAITSRSTTSRRRSRHRLLWLRAYPNRWRIERRGSYRRGLKFRGSSRLIARSQNLRARLFSKMLSELDIRVGNACVYAMKNRLRSFSGLVGSNRHDVEAGGKALEFVGKVIERVHLAAGRSSAQSLDVLVMRG